MFIRTQTTTLLEIFCKIILNVKVIFKSITDPEEEKTHGKMKGRLKTKQNVFLPCAINTLMSGSQGLTCMLMC